MSKNNDELYSITPFKENDHWYLKLIYKYENKQGKHTVVIPKAEVPFAQQLLRIQLNRIYNLHFSSLDLPFVMNLSNSLIHSEHKSITES